MKSLSLKQYDALKKLMTANAKRNLFTSDWTWRFADGSLFHQNMVNTLLRKKLIEVAARDKWHNAIEVKISDAGRIIAA